MRASEVSRVTGYHKRRGASLVEYGLLIGFVSMTCLLVLTAMGDGFRDVLDETSTTMHTAETQIGPNPPTTPSD